MRLSTHFALEICILALSTAGDAGVHDFEGHCAFVKDAGTYVADTRRRHTHSDRNA